MAIGAELELIPFDAETRSPVLIISGIEERQGSLAVVRRAARRAGWVEIPAAPDPPSWCLPDGGRLSFEPGGQIELSSAPSNAASSLIRDLQCTAQLLTSAFENAGIVLEAVGVDPYNDVAAVPLQLHRPRYERMTHYFESIGGSGVRMMRQTASRQINVDVGPEPYERWKLLNALAPYVTAIFANSPWYAGHATGHRSYRAHIWRTLDPSRTGLPVDTGNPVNTYLDFALDAGAMMRRSAGAYDSFSAWIRNGDPTLDDWTLHLSTLFPEVRPRGYFELRSADAIAPEYLAAPIAFVAGLVYHEQTAREASEILAETDPSLLQSAGREGLGSSPICNTSIRLIDLALDACGALGSAYLSPADLEAAAQFFDRYTRQGHSPGDDWS